MLHQGFNHDFMKLRKTFVCTKKTKITLFNDFFSLRQSSTGFHDSTRMHAYGAADAGTAAVKKKKKKKKAHVTLVNFLFVFWKLTKVLQVWNDTSVSN